jgi:hypothetical protein
MTETTTDKAKLAEFVSDTVLDVNCTIENATEFIADARHAMRIKDREVGLAVEELQYRRAADWLRKAAELLDKAATAVMGYRGDDDYDQAVSAAKRLAPGLPCEGECGSTVPPGRTGFCDACDDAAAESF